MKTLISLLVLLTGLVQAQTSKIGDTYGVAAMRALIAVEKLSFGISDASPQVVSLLDELETQISSPTEQASYDGITIWLKIDGDKGSVLFKTATTGPDVASPANLQRAAKLGAEYRDGRHPCYVALKTNLKHRDGAIPKECK